MILQWGVASPQCPVVAAAADCYVALDTSQAKHHHTQLDIIQTYTVSQKKRRHYTLVHIFAKY